MISLRYGRGAALLALLATLACDDATDPLGFDDLTAEEQLELSVLADEGSLAIATDLASLSMDAGESAGHPAFSEERGRTAEALAAFRDARLAWLSGDHRRALDSSRIARRLVARALIATGGVPAVEDLIERLEDVLLTIDAELVDDPDALRAELETILDEARALLAGGDSVGAAARAILGEQRLRLRRGRELRRDFRVSAQRAELEVAWAGVAVSLAERLLADDAVPPTDVLAPTDSAGTDVASDRNRWLLHARAWLARAERALEDGALARAVHAAHHAQWSALKAVILPGGVTAEEVRALRELAETLHTDATAALGDAPEALEFRVLNRAGDLIDIGIRRLEAGQRRGVAAFWRSAILSTWLLG